MGNLIFHMKQFAFAAFIGAASATWEEFNNTALPSLDNGQVNVEGEVGEYMNKWDDGTEQIGMHVRWTTSCKDCWFSQGALVQNYVEWPDEEQWWFAYDENDEEHPYNVVYNTYFFSEKKK